MNSANLLQILLAPHSWIGDRCAQNLGRVEQLDTFRREYRIGLAVDDTSSCFWRFSDSSRFIACLLLMLRAVAISTDRGRVVGLKGFGDAFPEGEAAWSVWRSIRPKRSAIRKARFG